MQGNVRLFEIGSVFEPRSGELPREELRVGALMMGRRQPPHFTDPKSPEFQAWATYDEWDAKSLAHLIAGAIYPGSPVELREAADPESLWEVIVGKDCVGGVRRVRLDAPVWAAPAYGVEITLGVMDASQVAPSGQSAYRLAPPGESIWGRGDVSVPLALAGGGEVTPRYQPLPTTPASEFDLALVVPNDIRAEQVEAVMRRVSGKLLERVELFDRYIGHGVEVGHRSLAWRLTFRHPERTLRDREIDARRTDILKALADELNVKQRTG
jgi:phenylalanyl-tRNA synthetase beta chain